MSKKFCLLPRQVLRVTGVDRISFLQGLVTQDMTKLSPSQSLYSLLLTPQGRFLHDFFVVPSSPDAHGFFIEIDPKFGNALLKRLTLYKLRSQVTIEDVSSSISVLAIWNDENLPQNPTGSTIFEGAEISYQDPRLSELGQRRLTQNLQETESHLQSSGYERTPEQTYHTHRLKLGVPDGGQDLVFEKSIPLECNMDELNAISWNKGCYMGQELTARTRYQGLVRKRLIPGKFSGAETLPFLSPLLWKDKEIGTLRSSESGFGIALVRLEALKECLEAQNSFKIQSTEETSTPPTWTPFIPQFLEKIFESA